MKSRIIEALKEHSHTFISGEELSQKLGVSRTAVWKVIKQLKEEGYHIESVSRKGYKLIEEGDTLNAEALGVELKNSSLVKDLKHFDSIDSTNTYAKDVASKGAAEGMLIISDEQVMGRGRLGRTWTSPKGTGIWMSLILRPDIEPVHAAKMTQIAAAAMNEAIIKTTGLTAGIKWPNDIIVNKKKVCGILTEMSAELNTVNYIVVGIGVNVNVDVFPEEIRDTATSLKIESNRTIRRKDLVVEFVHQFEAFYKAYIEEGNLQKTLSYCRDHSVTIGKKVRVIHKNETLYGEAIDLNQDGELLVKFENGEVKPVFYGEVSVRGLTDYI